MVFEADPPVEDHLTNEVRGESRALPSGSRPSVGGGYVTGTSRTGLRRAFRAPDLTPVQPLPVGLVMGRSVDHQRDQMVTRGQVVARRGARGIARSCGRSRRWGSRSRVRRFVVACLPPSSSGHRRQPCSGTGLGQGPAGRTPRTAARPPQGDTVPWGRADDTMSSAHDKFECNRSGAQPPHGD